MSRTHGLAISVLLALCIAAGASATLSTLRLGARASKPAVARAQALARRAKQLDAWQASLDRALRSRPPALPRVPHYAPVARIAPPGPLVLPAAPVAAQRVRPAGAPAASPAARPASAQPPSTQPPATQPSAPAPAPAQGSAEQQCEQLKQAAEQQGEAAKQAAERQCEQLKQSGEHDDG